MSYDYNALVNEIIYYRKQVLHILNNYNRNNKDINNYNSNKECKDVRSSILEKTDERNDEKSTINISCKEHLASTVINEKRFENRDTCEITEIKQSTTNETNEVNETHHIDEQNDHDYEIFQESSNNNQDTKIEQEVSVMDCKTHDSERCLQIDEMDSGDNMTKSSIDQDSYITHSKPDFQSSTENDFATVQLENLLVRTIDLFDKLSKHCPMTVMLWMKYGQTMYWHMYYCSTSNSSSENSLTDTSKNDAEIQKNNNSNVVVEALEMRIQIIELGLVEFPGSSMLQVHYVDLLFKLYSEVYHVESKQSFDNGSPSTSVLIEDLNVRFQRAIQNAIQNVGLGSHYNEDYAVAALYQIQRKQILWHRKFLLRLQSDDNDENDDGIHESKIDTTITNKATSEGKGRQNSMRSQRKILKGQLWDSYIKQSRVPMKDKNDDLINQILCEIFSNRTDQQHTSESIVYLDDEKDDDDDDTKNNAVQKISENKLWASKLYTTRFVRMEDDISTALMNEVYFEDSRTNNTLLVQKYLSSLFDDFHDNQHEETLTTNTNDLHISIDGSRKHKMDRISWWDEHLLNKSDCDATVNDAVHTALVNIIAQRVGMGLGGIDTSAAFVRYARALLTFRLSKHSSLHNDKDNENDEHDNKQCQENEIYMHNLAWSVYERGIAECPTIETLWLSYIRSLFESIERGSINNENNNNSSAAHQQQQVVQRMLLCRKIQSVTTRAVRNCPYSCTLLQQQLQSVWYLAENKISVFDPEQLLQYVDTGLSSKFLPMATSALDLYITAARVVKKRILSLISKIGGGTKVLASSSNINNPKSKHKDKVVDVSSIETKILGYDDMAEVDMLDDLNSKSKNSKMKKKKRATIDALTDELTQRQKFHIIDDNVLVEEINDLVEDLRDMYDEIDKRLKKLQVEQLQNKQNQQQKKIQYHGDIHPYNASLDRALMFKEQAITESLLLSPLLPTTINGNENNHPQTSDDEGEDMMSTTLRLIERSIRAHNPPHPDLYIHYIHQYMKHFNNFKKYTTPVTATGTAVLMTRVLSNLQNLRYLYDKAIEVVGNPYQSPIDKKKRKNNHKGIDDDDYKLSSVPLSTTVLLRDYESSLRELAHEWIEFEQSFGSERSLQRAKKAISKKMEKQKQLQQASGAAINDCKTHPSFKNNYVRNTKLSLSLDPSPTDLHKEKASSQSMLSHSNDTEIDSNESDEIYQTTIDLDGDNDDDGSGDETIQISNKAKARKRNMKDLILEQELKVTTPLLHKDHDSHGMVYEEVKGVESDQKSNKTVSDDDTNKVENVIGSKAQNKKSNRGPTVRIGNLDYPAHPYTVRVLSLPSNTKDMDLIHLLRPLCGPIVHARIVRDKETKSGHEPTSSGWGLVQFEEKDSVTKALALHDVVSIHQKLVAIERSHIPAVTLVPPTHQHSRQSRGDDDSKRKRPIIHRSNEEISKQDVEHHIENRALFCGQVDTDRNIPCAKQSTDIDASQCQEKEKVISKDVKKPLALNPNSSSVLSIRPRNIARKKPLDGRISGGQPRKKPKISLDGDDVLFKSADSI